MNKKTKFIMNKWFYVVVIFCVLLIAGVIMISIISNKKRDQKIQQQSEETLQDEMISSQSEEGIQQSDDKQISREMMEEFLIFDISNRDEVIDLAMGNWAYLMNEALAEYVIANDIDTTSAECFECNISDSDKQEMEFYFLCHDSEETILVAVYDSTDRTVIVHEIGMSKEQIEKNIWSPSGEPLVRDVSE